MALTAAQILEAKALRRQSPPVRWKELAGMYGVTDDTVRMDIDPDYRARRMAGINARRNEKRRENINGGSTNPGGNNGSLIARVRRKKHKPNFATFGHAIKFPVIDTMPVPDMDDADIVGVDYHANQGCKYILGDRRGGPHNLPWCCGGERVKRYVNGTETLSPYCLPHALRTGTGNYGRGR